MRKSDIYNIDARNIGEFIDSPIVKSTITSPPYFNLKDYGSKRQIGFGQSYTEYLHDLEKVFSEVYKVTKKNGTLWVILDTFRRNGEVIPLPFDCANVLKKIGWKLQDIIIWSKERTVPWAHKGQSRSVFEYILFFSKADEFSYHVDRIRDYENLKRWWIKYPERYNPLGKNLEEVWKFDIPTQGSWGNGYVKHFCPLPEGLVQRIINLTTNEGDVVLDPFAGSGTVPAQAKFMNRKYLGFELNKSYIKLFNKYVDAKGPEKKLEHKRQKAKKVNQELFKELIINLRILKYARVLRLQLLKNEIYIKKILVKKAKKAPSGKNKLVVVNYTFLMEKEIKKDALQSQIAQCISEPPLSKFGIEPLFQFYYNEVGFTKSLPTGPLFVYTEKETNYFLSSLKEARETKKNWVYVSDIKVRVKEKDWEEKHIT